VFRPFIFSVSALAHCFPSHYAAPRASPLYSPLSVSSGFEPTAGIMSKAQVASNPAPPSTFQPKTAAAQKIPRRKTSSVSSSPDDITAAGSPPTIENELSSQNLYKTELCRSFEETGACRYGLKCQFAHGKAEIRPVIRHPKYKTETCKTWQTIGTCPYGTRCRFIHAKDDEFGTGFVQIARNMEGERPNSLPRLSVFADLAGTADQHGNQQPM
jgi:hypothetical protein